MLHEGQQRQAHLHLTGLYTLKTTAIEERSGPGALPLLRGVGVLLWGEFKPNIEDGLKVCLTLGEGHLSNSLLDMPAATTSRLGRGP